MPVLTTETRLTEKEAHDIMGYIQKYRVDYGIIQRYVWLVIVRQKGVINTCRSLRRSLRQKRDQAGDTIKCFIHWIIPDMRTI